MVRRAIIGMALTIGLLAIPAAADTFRLKTGRILHGEIQNVDPQGFQFRRWENGGSFYLPWGALTSSDAARLRSAFIPVAAARPTVSCLRIITDQNTVYDGLLLSETADKLTLKLGDRRIPIPAKSVKYRVTIELDAEKVYTPPELYERRLAELDATTVEGNMIMAEYAMSLGLPTQARGHYVKVKEIDASRQEQIDRYLENFDRRVKEAEAKKLREDILALAATGKFEEAREKLAKLQEGYAETPAVKDIEAFKKKLQEEEELYKKNREELLRKKIPPDWYEVMERLIRRKAGERGIKLETARAYVEGNLLSEIKASLASRYGIEEGEVEKHWNEREKLVPPLGTRSASYGSGTWIIAGGQGGAIQVRGGAAGTGTGRTNQPPPTRWGGGSTHGGRGAFDRVFGGRTPTRSGNTPQPQAQAKPKEYTLETPEEWWQSASWMLRVDWLRALFAEKALKVSQRKERPCPQCGGSGNVTVSSGGASEELPCKRCHGTKNEVTVLYQ
jgi:hypothetical protein